MFNFVLLFFEFLLFLLSVYTLFYIPGRIIFFYGKTKLEYPTNIFLPITTGMIVFTIVLYVVSWMHIQIFMYPLYIFFLFYAWKKKLFRIPQIPLIHRKTSMLVLLLAFFFSLQMILNGNFGDSIYYFGDDMAHLGYISELRHAFPPQNPTFAGIPLRGYHFFYDFLIAGIANLTFLSPFSLYFHFMPFLVASGWAFGTYALLYSWTKKISGALWGVFLVLFGSSFGYLLFFLKNHNITLGSNFSIDQPNVALLNTPYSFSVVIIFSMLLLVYNYFKQRDIVTLLLIGVFVGISPIFKVYAGMILIAGFAIFTLIEIVRKNVTVLYAAALSLVIFLATFGMFLGSGAGLFYFPLWPIERMFDHIFPEYGYKEKIDTFSRYGVIKGLVETHLYTFAVFLIGNLGTRFIGILFLPFLLIKKRTFPSPFAFVLFSMMAISIIIPLFFAQTIKVFDMIQMLWYYPIFGAFFAALGLSTLLSFTIIPNIGKIIIAILIILFTLPLTYETTKKIVLPTLTAKRQLRTNDYFQAMKYLSNHGSYEDTVLDLPLDQRYTKVENLMVWFHSSSPHIPAFGNKRMYVGSQYIIFPNMPFEQRLAFVAQINELEYTKIKNPQRIEKIIQRIKDEKIKYIYVPRVLTFIENNTAFSLVFKNTQAVIYKVN